ncbi:MAG: sugar transferase [Clostridiales bacterium]|nr:sugar transferase [Clostridia bacterium]MCR4563108.1 sugar transferase [Clostridiales bacterium]
MKRKNEYKGIYTSIATLINIIIITGMYAYVWYTFYRRIMGNNIFRRPGNFLVIAVYAALYFILQNVYGGFKIGHLKLSDVLFAGLLSTLINTAFAYAQICLIAAALVKPTPLLFLFCADIAVLVLWGMFADMLFYKLFPPREILLIVGNEHYSKLRSNFDSRYEKFQIAEDIAIADTDLETVKQKALQYGSVILYDIEANIRNILLKFCFENSVRVYVTPKISDVIMRGGSVVDLFDTPLVLCRNFGLTLGQRIVKRIMDIVLSSIGIIITAPVMLIIAIAIKIEDGGPVFFKQRRSTLDNTRFNILKFRSMVVDADKDGFRGASAHDERITKVGRLIRPFRLDELPQFFNVFRGDMSIVGPRPERVEHMKAFTSEIPEFPFRLKVKGGLTGYAQVYGKYNTTPLDKLKLDLIYIQNYSFRLDVKLLLMTIKILFQKESTEGFDEKETKKIYQNYIKTQEPKSAEKKDKKDDGGEKNEKN